MDRKQFQKDFNIGSVSVDYILKKKWFENEISALQLNSNSDLIILPKYPTLEYINNDWYLCENSETTINGVLTKKFEPVINEFTSEIIVEILKLNKE